MLAEQMFAQCEVFSKINTGMLMWCTYGIPMQYKISEKSCKSTMKFQILGWNLGKNDQFPIKGNLSAPNAYILPPNIVRYCYMSTYCHILPSTNFRSIYCHLMPFKIKWNIKKMFTDDKQ